MKDPREIKMLDPACGSMHFGLYAFDLFEQIYAEAWGLEEVLGEDALQRLADLDSLHKTYPDKVTFLKDVPRLIIECNIHGVEIDPRAVQIAGLSLWLRAQNSWQSQGLRSGERPQIRRSNVVCAEPMPGDRQMLVEFLGNLRGNGLEALMRKAWHVPVDQKVRATPQMADALAKLVRTVWDEMELAGEAGSLLKIEETLRDAIAIARKESEEKSPLFRVLEYGLNVPTKDQYIQIVAGEDQDFFDRAEELVLSALHYYAEQAENGKSYRRSMFVEDAAQGFAFINLCQIRYDVLVMNPPFGEVVPSISRIQADYGKKNNDISALFLKRAKSFLNQSGFCGVIGPRSLFFLQSNEEIRSEVLLDENHLRLAADLGLRVMDSAWIEAIAFIFGMNPCGNSRFYRLLDSMQKEKDLQKAIYDFQSSNVIEIPTSLFSKYPFKSISYWLPQTYLGLFGKEESISSIYGTIRQGLATSDDFRYLRLWVECPVETIYKIYYPFGKGGEYSPFYGIPEVMVYWHDDGKGYWCDTSPNTGLPRSNIWMLKETINSYFLKPGITYTQRTNSAFSPRVLPANCIFATKGETIFCNSPEDLLFILGITQSRPFQALVEAFVANGDSTQSEGAARSYLSGLIKRLPLPRADQQAKSSVSKITKEIVEIKRQTYYMDETGQLFIHPFYLCKNFCDKKLSEIYGEIHLRLLQQDATVLNLSQKLNKAAEELYGLTPDDIRFLDNTLGKHPQEYSDHVVPNEKLTIFAMSDDEMLKRIRDDGITGRIFVNQSYHSSRKVEVISHLSQCKGSSVVEQLMNKNIISKIEEKNFAKSVISYLFGLAVGRWSVDLIRSSNITFSENLFEPLPKTSPGMTRFLETDTQELINDKNNGVWCDDPGFAFDIGYKIDYFIKLIWGSQSSNIEEELCNILGVLTLQKYINNSGLFFLDHLRTYSKSRRAAPIYWPLSTRSSSYTLWLTYHKLNDQTLYTSVNDFVDPKLKQVSEEAARLRLKKGRSPADEKELERLTDFERELKDFRDELLRVAKFWKPNLTDGVEITAAPLWKLFQHKPWQKRLKETWQKLEAGEYDWAHLAYSIWPERVREKCKNDKSLAIAHDLEELYVEPPASAKKKKAKKPAVDEETEGWFNDD
ncbi:MAG: BREX-1 system adenine-specific DNA-methyltransferase PglX [Anaerolineaceae bacterium]